jgi:hypothetical protein
MTKINETPIGGIRNMTSDTDSVHEHVASLLKSYCGRDPHSAEFQGCDHDHLADAAGVVQLVSSHIVPLALRELLNCTKAKWVPRGVIQNRIDAAMALRQDVPAR